MAADLREMQENQGFSENLIDKLEFVYFQLINISPITQTAIPTSFVHRRLSNIYYSF